MNKKLILYFAAFCNSGNFKWHSSGANTKIKQMIDILKNTQDNIYFFNYAPNEKTKLSVRSYDICSSINPIIYRLQILFSFLYIRKIILNRFHKTNLIIYNANLVSFLFYLSSLIFYNQIDLIIQVEDLPGARVDNIGLKGFFDKLIFKFLLGKSSLVLFASKGMKIQAQKKYKFKGRYNIFPPTISNQYLDIIASRKEPFKDKIINIMYAGSFNKEKGIEDLIGAFIKSKMKNHQLNLYGPCPNYLIKKYKKYSSVRFFGVVSYDNLYYAYANCDIVVNPHLRIINNSFIFPCKNIEVLASGALPLISRYSFADDENFNLPKFCIFDNEYELVSLLKKSEKIWIKEKIKIKKLAENIRNKYSQEFIAKLIYKNL